MDAKLDAALAASVDRALAGDLSMEHGGGHDLGISGPRAKSTAMLTTAARTRRDNLGVRCSTPRSKAPTQELRRPLPELAILETSDEAARAVSCASHSIGAKCRDFTIQMEVFEKLYVAGTSKRPR
jgi:hypothetical protein